MTGWTEWIFFFLTTDRTLFFTQVICFVGTQPERFDVLIDVITAMLTNKKWVRINVKTMNIHLQNKNLFLIYVEFTLIDRLKVYFDCCSCLVPGLE